MEKDKIEMLINVWKGNTNALLARFHQDQAPKMSKSVDFAETVSVMVVCMSHQCPSKGKINANSSLNTYYFDPYISITK